MALLIDTNVLIYAFDPASQFHEWADAALFDALAGAGAAVNPVILAELCVGETEPDTVRERLEQLGMLFFDLPCGASLRAAEAFSLCQEERQRSGIEIPQKTPLPDFFIGAHAELLNLRLATVDVSRYRTYFPTVELVTPPSIPGA